MSPIGPSVSTATRRRRGMPEARLVARLFPAPMRHRLANGLEVVLARRPDAPVVSTALVYGAGRRHDRARFGGTAHFLEHLMFRGAQRFADGEIDRLTRRLGGHNNAFTGHDSTVYEIAFAASSWHHALAIEADRMAGVALADDAVETERAIILEEVAMYEDEPWDALAQAVFRALFPHHPYGRPVLGTRAEIRRVDVATLHAFHTRWYRPANATLVVAGGFEDGALDAVAAAFEAIPDRPCPEEPVTRRRAPYARGFKRLERRHGDVGRLLVALPAPAAAEDDHPLLCLALAVLATGRSSRLQRALVERGHLAASVSCDLQESVDPGAITLAVEALPGVEPARIEATLRRTLAAFVAVPPKRAEVARARRMLLADWIFDHDRVHQQAQRIAHDVAIGDLERPARLWRAMTEADPDALHDAARRWLDLDRGVVGWSLAEEP